MKAGAHTGVAVAAKEPWLGGGGKQESAAIRMRGHGASPEALGAGATEEETVIGEEAESGHGAEDDADHPITGLTEAFPPWILCCHVV